MKVNENPGNPSPTREALGTGYEYKVAADGRVVASVPEQIARDVTRLFAAPHLKHYREVEKYFGEIGTPGVLLVLEGDPCRFSPETMEDQARLIKEFTLIVTENLFMASENKDLPPTRAEVLKMLNNIAEQRKLLKNVPLLQGKNCSILAFRNLADATDDENTIFGNQYLRAAVQAQMSHGKKFQFYSATTNLETALAAKTGFLSEVSKPEFPSAFIFDGHGNESELIVAKYNDEARQANFVTISAEELAEAATQKYTKISREHWNDLYQADNYIFASCYNSNFIHKFHQLLELKLATALVKSAAPIIAVGMSEYGQLGFSSDQELGTDFFETVCDLKSRMPVVMGTIMRNSHKGETDPVIWAPIRINGRPIWGALETYISRKK